MKVKIIGIGMGSEKNLTAEAAEAIKAADVLIGARRMLEPFKALGKPMLEEYRSEEISRFLEENEYQSPAVLVSGDCGFFSGARKLTALLKDADTELICGIASPVYFLSKLKKDWSDCHFVSLHGQNGNIVRSVCAHEKTFFLLGGSLGASDVCKKLCDYGMGDISLYIGENLGSESEKITSGKACEIVGLSTCGLSVMLAENPDYERQIPSGIDDEEFIRGKVPMTKKEVRAITVSGLEIGKNDLCWDIGSGTGSVSVEMAVRCENGTVHAVEKNPEAAALTAENSRKFGCDNIEIHEGEAAEIVGELPPPDCVFIGGSSGKIGEIVGAALDKNSNVRLTITAVSLETLVQATEAFDKLGMKSEITQIAVTRTRKVGNHTMLTAENPIYIIKRKF